MSLISLLTEETYMVEGQKLPQAKILFRKIEDSSYIDCKGAHAFLYKEHLYN